MTQLGNEQGRGGRAERHGGRAPAARRVPAGHREVRRGRRDPRRDRRRARHRHEPQEPGERPPRHGPLRGGEPDLQGRARDLREDRRPEGRSPTCWNDFGALHEGRGEYAEARKAYQEALRIRRELGDERQLAQSYDNVGLRLLPGGRIRQRARLLAAGPGPAPEDRRQGAGIVLSMQNMGFLQTAQGRWAEAMKSFLDTLEKSREIDFKNAMAVSHGNIGLLHQYEGATPPPSPPTTRPSPILTALDDKRGLAEFTIKQAAALLELGRLDEAKAKLDAAAAWVRETGNREQSADYQAALGEWHLARGDRELAERALNRAVEEATASRSRAAMLRATLARDRARVLLGDAAAAARELASSVREAEALGDVLLRIRASEALAGAELARGRTARGGKVGQERPRAGRSLGLPSRPSSPPRSHRPNPGQDGRHARGRRGIPRERPPHRPFARRIERYAALLVRHIAVGARGRGLDGGARCGKRKSRLHDSDPQGIER